LNFNLIGQSVFRAKRHIVFALVALALFEFSFRAMDAATTSSQIDRFVRSEMVAGQIPGLSIAVVRNGKLVFADGYGLADIEQLTRATPTTIYPIASLSKQFTAAAIMLLVQDARLDLSAPIAPRISYLNPPSSWKSITVRQLLNQTSGIPNFLDLADITKGSTTTPQTIIDLIRNKPLSFAPGTEYEYSNSNYFLLALVAESVSRVNIYKLLDDHVFHPLGLNATGEYDCTANNRKRAAAYVVESGKLTNEFTKVETPFLVGCGGIQTTVLDLAKWDTALYTNTPLTAASKKAMWTPPSKLSTDYGFGWIVDSINGHRLIWHNGAIPGATCWMGRYVDDKLTVIVLSNLFNADNVNITALRVAEIGEGIAGLFLPVLRPVSLSPEATIDPKLVAICKKAIVDIDDGTADPAMYTPAAAQALFPNAIAQTGAIFKALGPFQSLEPLSRTKEYGMNVITCRVTFGATALVYAFALTVDANQIAGIIPQH
jgi:D-alanyl-D-alanine carboxypeptidase